MTTSFPQTYKADLLKAIETIDMEKVNQAIEILVRAQVELVMLGAILPRDFAKVLALVMRVALELSLIHI